MGDVDIPPDESVDPPAARVGPDFPWWDRSQAGRRCRGRDGPGAGFTTGPPVAAARRPTSRRATSRRRRADPGLGPAPATAGCSRRGATLPALQDGAIDRRSASTTADVLAYTRARLRTGRPGRRRLRRGRRGDRPASRPWAATGGRSSAPICDLADAIGRGRRRGARRCAAVRGASILSGVADRVGSMRALLP